MISECAKIQKYSKHQWISAEVSAQIAQNAKNAKNASECLSNDGFIKTPSTA